MQNNQQLVRFNQLLTKEINKKALNTFNVCKSLFNERKPSINKVKITQKLNWGLQTLTRN